jgi:thiosulfate dehydrogenase
MGKFLLGLIVGLVVVPLAVYVYFARGMAPIATSAEPMPFEKSFARMALHARVEKQAPTNVPIPASEENFLAGAKIYKEHCAVCHGLPGVPQTAIAKGEFPKPPVLLEGKGVTDDPAGESYFKVDQGIRMTGMPGFGKYLSTTEMWQVSLLLASADKLPQSVKDALTATPATAAVPPATQSKK